MGSDETLEPLDRYRARLLAAVAVLPAQEASLDQAAGRVSAEPVLAHTDLPPFDNSAMDGFAVRAGEAAADAALAIAGEVAAGSPGDQPLPPASALRISTGAPLPQGADAVLPIEHALEHGGRVRVLQPPAAGAHLRRRGEDLAAGAVALAAGTRLGPVEIALAAACGLERLLVRARPRVAVLPTGDELSAPDRAHARGLIRDSNGPALAAAVREAGGEPTRHPPVADRPDMLADALRRAVAGADAVVLTGGVSVGRHDHVREVFERLGEALPARVAMQPGKPQAFGLVDATPCFGLPGNPVSALVSFEVFVRPVLRRLAGLADRARPRVPAVAGAALPGGAGRVRFVLVRLADDGGRTVASPTGPQASHRLRGAAGADAFVVVPAGVGGLPAGSRVDAWLLSGEGWIEGAEAARMWAARADAPAHPPM